MAIDETLGIPSVLPILSEQGFEKPTSRIFSVSGKFRDAAAIICGKWWLKAGDWLPLATNTIAYSLGEGFPASDGFVRHPRFLVIELKPISTLAPSSKLRGVGNLAVFAGPSNLVAVFFSLLAARFPLEGLT